MGTPSNIYRGSNGDGDRYNGNTAVTGINAAVLPWKWGEMRRKLNIQNAVNCS